MKKIMFLLFVFFPLFANAMTMCMHTGSYIATLVKSRDGVSTSTDGAGGWTTNFDYNTSNHNTQSVTGFASCNDTVGTTNTADSAVSAAVSDTGTNCWCMMGTPLVSDWVYLIAYASDSDCASGCAVACANAAKTSSDFRAAIYEHVW